MATILFRPLSAMSNGTDPAIPQRQRRESIEVIDVDSLEDDMQRRASVQPSPLRRRRPNVAAVDQDAIIVLDSDEEEPIPIGREQVARNRLFSPPPNFHRPSPVPPVPPVPARYAGYTSLPTRPPVRAIARPFDFERARYPTPTAVGRRSGISSPSPQPSAPSHHVPSMGLGGALISSYREAHQRQNNHLHHAQSPQPGLLARAGAAASGLASRISRNLVNYGIGGPGTNGVPTHRLGGDHPHHDHHYHHHHHHHRHDHHREDEAVTRVLIEAEMQELFEWNHRHLLRHFVRDQSQTYLPAYTHPRPPEPGFSYDFGADSTPTSPNRPRLSGPIIIDDDDMEGGPSSSSKQAHRASSPVSVKSTTVLVCVKCLEPLVLSAGLVGRDAERRRVWALRCGHMIDGKCLKEIGQPLEGTLEDEMTIKTDVKGKGKARASANGNVKGKGKAKMVEEEPEADSKIPLNAAPGSVSPSPPDNPIRSRLRSSRTSSHLAIPVTPPPLTSPGATRRKRGRKPKIEANYRFLCPVVGCGSIHVSVKVDGLWRPERDEDRKKPGGRRSIKYPDDLALDSDDVRGRGAIPVFV